jgi:N-carbamoylputrescine amidase
MRVALAQMNSAEGARERNVARAVELIGAAADQRADLVLLPELFSTEYFPQYRDLKYLDYAESLDGPSLGTIANAARKANVWVVATIFEKLRPGLFFDTAVLIDREGIRRGAYRKTHPAAVYSLEKIYFRYGGHFPIMDVEGWPTGIMICYDAMFPEVARTLALRGAELILVPFAAHPAARSYWRQLHSIRAFENGCYVAVCNKVGKEGDWEFGGESLVACPSGELLAIASDKEDDLVIVDLERGLIDTWRQRFPMFRDRRPDLYTALVTPPEDL